MFGIFCVSPPEEPAPTEETTVHKETSPPPKTLSDIQVTACNAADEGGTCKTKLPKLDIVTAEECCKNLGKCC